MQVLVIEDNPQAASLMQKGFQELGYKADTAALGFAGEESAARKDYDVIVLDRMLPDRDGIEVCRNLRRRGVSTPIVMLTALGETEERVAGLDSGADDYLAKPFEFNELVARIRAIMRRGESVDVIRLTYDTLELNLGKRTATREGKTIGLTNREFALLEFLVRRKERVVPRSTIAEQVWDMNYEPTSNVIDVYISMLRRKVDHGFSKPLIHTIVGVGYMLAASPSIA